MQRFRYKLHEIIFEADTRAGKLFDVFLIISIVLSVFMVMLDSVGSIRAAHGSFLYFGEWFFTYLFTLEYFLRLFCVDRPLRYSISFFGIVDLLAFLPTYFSIFIPGTQFMLIIRILRVLRIFRVLKLVQHLTEAEVLMGALRKSRHKITVFLFVVIVLVIIFGSIMYFIEGGENGFTSIPRSIYWAVVTLTTVGYGDISPKTNTGQALSAFIMVTGYAIIAIPTGIVTAEISKAREKHDHVEGCTVCGAGNHDNDARFCKYCGNRLNSDG